MSRGEDVYRVEEWNGFQIHVDRQGTFCIFDENGSRHGNRIAEAKTLDALKAKVGGGNLTVDIRAVRFTDSYFSERERTEELRVYAISNIGNILVEVRGKTGRDAKEKCGRSDAIYLWDDAKIAERTRLRDIKRKAERDLESLMKHWPRVDGDALRKQAGQVTGQA